MTPTTYLYRDSEYGDGHATNLRVSDDIQQRNNVGATGEVLEDLDFSLDLLLLHGLQNLDDAFLVVDNIDPFEDFRVLSTA